MMKQTGYGLALCAVLLVSIQPLNGALADAASAAVSNELPVKEVIATDVLIAEAQSVIQLMSTDNVAAAKQADKIFAAANRLFAEGRLKEAQPLFETGLQLTPWDMPQQLNYARVLLALGENDRAAAVAKLVFETSENARLLLQSGEIGGMPPPSGILPLPTAEFDQPVIAFVRIGEVDDWVIQRAGNRLAETLGSPVFVSTTVIDLPPPHRSYLERWSGQLRKDVVWTHPFVQAQMRDIGITMPELATLEQTLEILARITVAQGQPDPRPNFPTLIQEASARDRQWDAEQLMILLRQAAPERDNIVVIGLTQADIYAGDSNFVFGTADMGGHYALVSTQRFEAQYNNERESQPRLLDRLHKQLLSSSGFALGIPRPTDPRSARSYPNSLADQDLKGTFLSPGCVEAFAKALEHPLPAQTVQASLAQ